MGAILALSNRFGARMTNRVDVCTLFGLILASAWLPTNGCEPRDEAHTDPLISGISASAIVGLQPEGIQVTPIERNKPPKSRGDTFVFYGGKLRHPADLQAIERAAKLEAGQERQPIAVFDPKGILKSIN